MDRSTGITKSEFGDKSFQRSALANSPCVSRLAVFVKAADICYADRTVVVAETVSPDAVGLPTLLDRAIERNKIMITDSLKPALTMITRDVIDMKIAIGRRGGAMNDNFRNSLGEFFHFYD